MVSVNLILVIKKLLSKLYKVTDGVVSKHKAKKSKFQTLLYKKGLLKEPFFYLKSYLTK